MAFSDARQCNATAKSTGEQCQLPAITGSSKCRLHGGKTPKGSASPHWQGKGRSRYLPQRLADSYAELEHDTEYTDLRANLKMYELFVREKLTMLDEHPESEQFFKEFKKALSDFRKAWANENYGAADVAYRELERLTDERLMYFEIQREIRSDLAEQRKTHQAIASIEYKGENAVTAGELMTFVSAVLNLIANTVPDKQTQSKIFNGIQSLVTVDNRSTDRIRRLSTDE